MANQEIYCPVCHRRTHHIKARAAVIMCTICRTERPANTTGWRDGTPASSSGLG
jgi:hypothetical protein